MGILGKLDVGAGILRSRVWIFFSLESGFFWRIFMERVGFGIEGRIFWRTVKYNGSEDNRINMLCFLL